jgi:RHS repeat-associated protein
MWAWGEVRYASGNTLTKHQYTGQFSYEAEFGLYFYNARWYDSSLGRFAQADTLIPGSVQGYDRYAYGLNNPARYIDPSGHVSCSGSNWDDGPQCFANTSIQYWKDKISRTFGITMSEENDAYNAHAKAWNLQNLKIVFSSLSTINESLNGKLKSLAGGATFKWGDYNSSPCGGGSGIYCGYTYGTTVTFYNIGQAAIRLQNIFHEFGHVLDSSSKTYNAFSHADGINNPEFLDDNGRLDYSALINQSHDMYQDNLPVYNVSANDMVKGQNEHWADMFANYVAGNIDLDSPQGAAMNTFVTGALAPYIGTP